MTVTITLTDRQAVLVQVALDSAASAVQSGATLCQRGVDPLAREYLLAADVIERASR